MTTKAPKVRMTAGQQLREEGRQEGRREVREAHRARHANFLLSFLKARFHPLPSAATNIIQSGSIEQLICWTERCLSATSWEEVLQENASTNEA